MLEIPRGRGLLAAALLLFCTCSFGASPLVAPGDYQFRHDLMLLGDAGLLSGPLNMWPVSLPQIGAGLTVDAIAERELSPAVAAALARVQWRLRRAQELGAGGGVRLRVGTEPQFLRSFGDTPRGETEVGAHVHWTTDRFAGELRLSYVDEDPADDDEWRLDGSWLGVILGDWMLAATKYQRYWGPGWQGGLILSNNARPRPGVTLRRMRAEPFDSWLLSWIGPWHMAVFVEHLGENRAVPNVLFAGMRFAFMPFETLEIGISRTSQFGGEGRHVGFDTIVNVITGQTTSTNPAVGSAEDINQLGGFDLRWRIPWINAALYGELIGEDEEGSLPTLIIGQGGLEFWGGFGGSGSSWRLILEYADTKADLLDSNEREGDAEFGIAYNNGSFPTGYRYRNRVLGHPIEGDALLSSARLLVSFAGGSFINLAYLEGELNRAAAAGVGRGGRNTLTTFNEDVTQIELSWHRQFAFGKIELGVGRTERSPTAAGLDDSDDTFAWLGLSRQF